MKFGKGERHDNGLVGTIVELAGKLGNEGDALSLPNGEQAFKKIQETKDSLKVLAWQKGKPSRLFKDADAEQKIQDGAQKARGWLVHLLSSKKQ